ncbi:transglycosylase SLT domain-containing protein [Dechloromonas hortensis]|uniref:transglycosylase SLT domain-containing protein n=1 Tax=Dechloromonas hortensis TaxID=337779 RepID=UPI00129097AB|nr:transglycosylase SLT domain-containing protein [Dechloromonas hortensis]
MFASTTLSPAVQRVSTVVYVLLQKFLMAAGLVFVFVLLGLLSGYLNLSDSLKSAAPVSEAAAVAATEEPESPSPEATPSALNPRMRGALDYVSRRYRVSTDALQPIFATAQTVGRELHLDPLLIIAVIGVESGFNPFSQSVFGAQGLMQVVPRFHLDKLPDEAAPAAFLDPVTNVQVGARVLKESISRNGGLEDGLQQFGGASNDPERRYSLKVLAEKQRLEQATQRLRTT